MSGARLLKCFPLSECGTHRYNPRLLAEGKEQRRKSELAAEAGRRSAEAKKQRTGNGKPTDVAPQPTDVEKMATESQLVKTTVTIEQQPSLPDSATPHPATGGSLPKAEPCPLTAAAGGRTLTGKRARAADEGGPLGFAAFWEAYHGPDCPKRGSRKGAEKRWAKIPDATRGQILAGLDAYRADATRNGNQYLPYAEKFLNPERAIYATEDYGKLAVVPAVAKPPAPAPFPNDPHDLWNKPPPTTMASNLPTAAAAAIIH